MKTPLLSFLLAASALAQPPVTVATAACGPKAMNFNVTLDDTQHTLVQPDQGKARVYFILDDGPLGSHQHYTLKIGLDGAWVGAYKQNSFLVASVEPGEHHVCANVQSIASIGHLLALAHFTAEAGKIYYFRTRFIPGINTLYPVAPYLDLDPLDSDEAKYLIASYPFSLSQLKK